jgi:hypothetical protein
VTSPLWGGLRVSNFERQIIKSNCILGLDGTGLEKEERPESISLQGAYANAAIYKHIADDKGIGDYTCDEQKQNH